MYGLFMKKLLLLSLVSIFLVACPGAKEAPPGSLVPDLATLNFGYQAVNTPGKELVATLTNVSNVDITDIVYGLEKNQKGIFTIGGDCPTTLLAGASCKVAATFLPDSENSFSDKFNFTYKSSAGPSTASVTLRGLSTGAAYDVPVATNLLAAGLKARPNTTGKDWDVVDLININNLITLTAELGYTSDEYGFSLRYQGQDSIITSVQQSDIDAAHKGTYSINNLCSTMSNGEKCSVLFSYTPTLDGADEAIFTVYVTYINSTTEEFYVHIGANGTIKVWDKAPVTVAVTTPSASAETVVGKIATSPTELTVTNTTANTVFYKVVTRSPDFTYELGTCNLVLAPMGNAEGKDKCVMYAYHNPTKVNETTGYVGVAVGKNAVLVQLTGKGLPASSRSGENYKISADSIDFAKTEIGFTTAAKRLTVENAGETAGANGITISVPALSQQTFRHTTTCVEGRALAKGQKCYVDVQFAPSEIGDNESVVTVNELKPDKSLVAAPAKVTMKGTGIAVVSVDSSTPIAGVTVDTKRVNFPDTPVGQPSGYQQIKITNSNDYAIIGFQSSSSSLTRFPQVTDTAIYTCKDTIAAKEECFIAYTFNAKDTSDVTAAISIWDSSVKDEALRYNEIIEVKARGVLTNKSLNFGYVAPTDAPKTIAVSYVNDTKSAQTIGGVKVKGFTTEWNWIENKNSFTSDRFADHELALDVFTLTTTNCTGRTLKSGESCIIKVQFDPVKAAATTYSTTVPQIDGLGTPVGTSTTPDAFRAHVIVWQSDENTPLESESRIVGRLHAVASTKNNTIVYFPVDSAIPDKPTFKDAFAPKSVADAVLTVIDERLYALGGLASKKEADDGLITDKDVGVLKVYDTARNVWRKLTPSGTNPMVDVLDDAGGSVAVPAITVVNKRLYLIGGNYITSKSGSKSRIKPTALYSYDPYDIRATADGHWSKIATTGEPKATQGASAASINGYLFVFGGLTNDVINDFYALDLRDPSVKPRWDPIGDKMGKDAKTYPPARSNAAMAAHGGRLYLHGGDINKNGAPAGDLWEFTPTFDDKTGNYVSGVWKRIHVNDNNGIAAVDGADLKPAKRIKHSMSVVGGDLYLAGMGFKWAYQKVDVDQKKYFKITRPTDDEILAYENGGAPVTFYSQAYKAFEVSEADFKKLGSDGYYNGDGTQNESLYLKSGHGSAAIEGIFWFHSVNIMGVLIK